MTLKVWSTFHKDRKSTKQPNQTDAREVEITLKENTSVINPTFILRWDVTPEFNYCQWIAAYYYVEDVTIRSKDVYEISCSMDILASYRSDILSSTQFVLRSASQFNPDLFDSIYEPELDPILSTVNTTAPHDTTGIYIAKYSSCTSSRYGVVYRCGTATEVGSFIKGCYDLDNWDNFLSVGLEALQKTVFDFSQYIQEIYWLPCARTDIPNRYSIVPFVGAWQIDSGDGGTEEFLGESVIKLGVTLNTPQRYYNDFRDFSSTYTQFVLSIPAIGEINLDPKDVYKGLQIQYALDLKTGDVSHVISSGNNIITKISGNYKVPVSYATFNNNFVAGAGQMLNSAVETGVGVASAFTGNYGGAASGITSGVIGLAEGLVNMGNITSHQVGNQGSMAQLRADDQYRLTRHVYDCAQPPYLNIGRKLNEYRVLNTLSGFTQCQNAILSSGAYGQVKEEIESAMNSGFIIE